MAGSWIRRRRIKGGTTRYRIHFRTGGRESREFYGGTFRTLREARERKRYVDAELAAMRFPDIRALDNPPPKLTIADAAEAWRQSRLDVAETTKVIHRVALKRLLPHLGHVPLEDLTAAMVAEWVAALHERGYKRSTIAKSLTALRQLIDHAGVDPNPARDQRVRLPREVRSEIEPPTQEHVEAVIEVVAPRYRLPIIVLEATGMRIGELEALRWGDVDEARGRWRVSRTAEKTARGRWVEVQAEVFDVVLALVPREDRDPTAQIFPYLAQERLRTEIRRACTATGTPLFSPHDLRHRRISLWHRDGVPWANIGQRVGQRNLSTTADVYTHVVVEGEIDRERHL